MFDARSATRIVAVAVAGIVIGTAASLASVAFVQIVTWANRVLLIAPEARQGVPPGLLTAMTLAVPTLGGLVVGLLVTRLIASGRPLGPADVILAVQIRKPMPDRRSEVAGTLAALVSLCAGASVGHYAPLVFMGGSIGALVRRLEARFRDIRAIAIACGVAAAISAAFHAPIAGLIFAHEVVLRHYALRAFAPVAVAAATGHVAAQWVFGREPILPVDFAGVAHSYEFFFFAAEGLLAAFVATLFLHLVLRCGQIANRVPLPRALKPALAGLVLGIVALQVPEVLGIGRNVLLQVSQEGAYGMGELIILATSKMAMTALCLGFGFAGGVFSPALMVGGFVGALYGLALAALLPTGTSGVLPYAICGMMAVTSPVIGAPLSTILIVFELTGSYDLTIAVMAAVAFANLVVHRTFGRSLFDVQLLQRGHDLSFGRDRAMLACRPVADFLSQDYVAMRPEDDAAAMLARCTESHRSEVMLTDETGRYRGHVRLQDVLGASGSRLLADFVKPDALVFGPATTLLDAMERLRGFVGEAVPLVGPEGRLLGVVPESAVFRGYISSIQDLRREENAGA